MNTEYIRDFVVIADLGNYSRAADILHISQSSLSKHIQALESELRSPLFDRSTRVVKLSEYGRRVLPFCREIIQAEEDIRKVDLHRKQYSLKMTSIPVAVPYGITSVIARFSKRYPELSVSLAENEDGVIQEELLHGIYELGFVRKLDNIPEVYETIPFAKDVLVAALPADNPLARKNNLSLEDLRNESFIMFEDDTNICRYMLNLCQNHGFTPHMVQRSNRLDTAMNFVAEGFGITLTFRAAAMYYKKPNVIVKAITPTVASELYLARIKRREMTYAAKAFWDFNLEILRSMGM